MESTSLAQGLQNLEAELQDAFDRIQNHLKFLRQDFVSDTATSQLPDTFEKVDALGDWLLKDDVMSIPYEEPSALSGDALHLSAEMLGASAHAHMRMNSHLMELSMRAAESVHVLRKERLRTHATNHGTNSVSPNSKTRGISTELERCESILQIIPPNSKFRLVWDLCGVVLIVLDAFLLPMTMAWSQWEISPVQQSTDFSSRLLQLFAITSLVFWPCDILVNFNTAFYIRGFIESRRWEIAKRYAHTWLPFDVCVVAVDFLAGFLGQATDLEIAEIPKATLHRITLLNVVVTGQERFPKGKRHCSMVLVACPPGRLRRRHQQTSCSHCDLPATCAFFAQFEFSGFSKLARLMYFWRTWSSQWGGSG